MLQTMIRPHMYVRSVLEVVVGSKWSLGSDVKGHHVRYFDEYSLK